MAWSPLSEMVAVGAAHGVCLWRIFEDESDPDPALTTGWMGFLQHPRLLAIRDLSWSPSGRLLATASPGDAALLVWDVALRTCKFVWAPRPPVAVEWSPMGGHLFAAFEGGAFAIWETARWNMELFEFPGRFCAAAWAPDGLRLAIVMDHLEENDRCWFDATEDGDGAPPTWIPATFCGDVGGPLLGGALVGTGGGGGGGGGVAAAAAAAAAVAAAGAAGGGFRGQQAGQRERGEQVRVRVDDELGNPGEVEVVDRARACTATSPCSSGRCRAVRTSLSSSSASRRRTCQPPRTCPRPPPCAASRTRRAARAPRRRCPRVPSAAWPGAATAPCSSRASSCAATPLGRSLRTPCATSRSASPHCSSST